MVLIYEHLEKSECLLIHKEDFDEVVYDELKKDKVILFDDEFYYVKDSHLKKICESLTAVVSFAHIKEELYKEGTLIRSGEADSKNQVREIFALSKDGKELRPRLVKLRKDMLESDDATSMEEYVETLGGMNHGY